MDWTLFGTGFVITFVAIFYGKWLGGREWKAEILRRGHAQYNVLTGKWEWKETI